MIHTTLARKRTGDAEIGWRPAPEKNIETLPCWGKNSPEKCLVDLGRDTRTSTQSRRIVRRKDASWSLNWPSGANLLGESSTCTFFGASVTTVCLFFFVIGRVLTRLDYWRLSSYLEFPLQEKSLGNSRNTREFKGIQGNPRESRESTAVARRLSSSPRCRL